jgi:hypothetical protein
MIISLIYMPFGESTRRACKVGTRSRKLGERIEKKLAERFAHKPSCGLQVRSEKNFSDAPNPNTKCSRMRFR